MKRRNFNKAVFGATVGMASGLGSCQPSADSNLVSGMPSQWVWFRPDIKKPLDHWKRTFEWCRDIGIEGILPQVYSSNETLFDHPTLKVREPWLEKIIPIAHEAGLQVHAWMWTMPLNNPELIAKHPDWFSVNRLGQPAHTHPAYVPYYKFMCPCHPEVQEFVAGNVEALGKIEGLDGIHLDYVRQPDVILAEALQPKYDLVQDSEFPEYDYPYSERCRNQFKEKTGIDPIDLGDSAPKHAEWRQFRYDAVSNVVNNFCVPRAKKYDKKITAAVFPNWESVRQQWHKWDLDAFFPMLYQGFYNKNVEWIGEEVEKAKMRLKNDKPIFAGVFLPDCKGEILNEAIKVIQNSSAQGIAFFELGNLGVEERKVIKQLLNSSH